MNRNVFFTILLTATLLASGCATDPYYTPQSSTYGRATTIGVPSGNDGMDVTGNTTRLARRVPQERSMRVSWDLRLWPARWQQRAPERRNCEVLIKQPGAINWTPYRCEKIERSEQDFFVYYYLGDRLTAINLATMPGDFVRNGFCESEIWSPARVMTARVVWQTHESVRPTGHDGLLRRGIGCRPG